MVILVSFLQKIIHLFRLKSVKQKYVAFQAQYPFYYKLFDLFKAEIKHLLKFDRDLVESVIDYSYRFFR